MSVKDTSGVVVSHNIFKPTIIGVSNLVADAEARSNAVIDLHPVSNLLGRAPLIKMRLESRTPCCTSGEAWLFPSAREQGQSHNFAWLTRLYHDNTIPTLAI
jgi:hypothetical protein